MAELTRGLALFTLCLGTIACAQGPETDIWQQAESRLAEARAEPEATQPAPLIVRDQGYFVPPLALPEREGPAWFAIQADFALEQYPLQDALHELLSPLGVSVRLLDHIDPDQPITLRHYGTTGEALERIALLTGLSYTAEGRLLTWRRYEMAEFDVAFLAGHTNYFLGSEAGPAQSMPTGTMPGNPPTLQQQNSQYLNFSSQDLSVWDDLERALRLLLSEQGELAINQSSTSVLVRDLPQYVQQVREYLMQQNKRLTRQVAIDVQVLDVTFHQGEQVGIDWDLVYQATRGRGVLNMAGSTTQGLNTGPLSLQFQHPRGGAQALIDALGEQGVVKVSSHPRVVTLNNQISQIALEDSVTYLASAGASATANVGTSELLIPGVVRTGFELYVLPKVANQQVMLQLSTSLSDLKRISQISSGDATIQTPETSRKQFFMKNIVADNETLLISGLNNSRQEWQQRSTLGSWLFGGQRRQRMERTETVVLLTPRILPSGTML